MWLEALFTSLLAMLIRKDRARMSLSVKITPCFHFCQVLLDESLLFCLRFQYESRSDAGAGAYVCIC